MADSHGFPDQGAACSGRSESYDRVLQEAQHSLRAAESSYGPEPALAPGGYEDLPAAGGDWCVQTHAEYTPDQQQLQYTAWYNSQGEHVNYDSQAHAAQEPLIAHVVTDQSKHQAHENSQRQVTAPIAAPSSDHFGRRDSAAARGSKDARGSRKRTPRFSPFMVIAPLLALAAVLAGIGVLEVRKMHSRASMQAEAGGPGDNIRYVDTPERIDPAPDEFRGPQLPPLDRPEIPLRSLPAQKRAPSHESEPGRERGAIFFTSNPSGARIYFNDRYLGLTPFTWHNPPVTGNIGLAVESPDGERQERNVDYAGGGMRRHFELEQISAPRANISQPQRSQSTEPAVAQAIQKTARKSKISPTLSAMQSPRSAPERSGAVFIATIPPAADIFIDGQKIGKANETLRAPAGTHEVEFIKGDLRAQRTITISPGKNPATIIRLQ
jgi:hypothetical protein